jgi:hypothetical protein
LHKYELCYLENGFFEGANKTVLKFFYILFIYKKDICGENIKWSTCMKILWRALKNFWLIKTAWCYDIDILWVGEELALDGAFRRVMRCSIIYGRLCW